MSSTIEDGGNAFPTVAPRMTQHGHMSWGADTVGMSLRDWFAGQVLGGLGSALNTSEGTKLLVNSCHQHDVTPAQVIAITAYQIADAMIAERKVKL